MRTRAGAHRSRVADRACRSRRRWGSSIRRNEQESKDRNVGAPAIRRQAPENVEDVWNFGLTKQERSDAITPNETPLFEIHHFDVSSAAGDAGRAGRQVTQAKCLIAPPQRRRHHGTTPCNGGVARRTWIACCFDGSAAVAQDAYPTRPVRIVVGFPAGTATDITTRIYAEKLSVTLQSTLHRRKHAGRGYQLGCCACRACCPGRLHALCGKPTRIRSALTCTGN